MSKEIQKSEQITDTQIIGYLENMGMLQKLSNGEKDTFLQISKAFGLNPFKREIYASKFGETFSIVVGFEVYLKRAERSGLLDGWDVLSEGSVQDNSLKAKITIYRKDRSRPFVHEVYYSEYVQRTKDGHPNKFWREKPVTMIKKVAMGQGFRLCFSDELGGMPYTAEEITTEAQYEVISTRTIEVLKSEIEPITTLEALTAYWATLSSVEKTEEIKGIVAAKGELLKKQANDNNSNI